MISFASTYSLEGVDFRFFWKIDVKGPDIYGKYRQKKIMF